RSISLYSTIFFFFHHPAPTDLYTLSLHDALPISLRLCGESEIRIPQYEIALRLAGTLAPFWRIRGHLAEGNSWLSRLQVTADARSEEHTSELQSRGHLVCRLLLEKKKICY